MDPTSRQICLELKDVFVDRGRQQVLKGISLRVEEQEIVSIIGPNGAGKTTVFNIICGQAHPRRGSVYYLGRDVTGWRPDRMCRLGIARTFQSARPFPEMTAVENVLIGLWFGKKGTRATKESRSEAVELLDLVGLSYKIDTPAKNLTLSEQRRLEVARALATRPHLLLLDEIGAGLSPQAISQAVHMVMTLRDRGLTLVIVDHFLNLTVRVSDRLIAMDQGEIIVEGKPSEVLKCRKVVSAYLGEHQQRELL